MFSPKNSFASGKGAEFAALLSDYGGVRVKLSQLWRIAQCVRGTSGRPQSGANFWRLWSHRAPSRVLPQRAGRYREVASLDGRDGGDLS